MADADGSSSSGGSPARGLFSTARSPAGAKLAEDILQWQAEEVHAWLSTEVGVPEFANGVFLAANKEQWRLDGVTLLHLDAVRTPRRLNGVSISHSKSILYGDSVWARRALNVPKLLFPARAGGAAGARHPADGHRPSDQRHHGPGPPGALKRP